VALGLASSGWLKRRLHFLTPNRTIKVSTDGTSISLLRDH